MRLPFDRYIRTKCISTDEQLAEFNQELIRAFLPPITWEHVKGPYITRKMNLELVHSFFMLPHLRIKINMALLKAWSDDRKNIIDIAWKILKPTNIFREFDEFRRYQWYYFDVSDFNVVDMDNFFAYLKTGINRDELEIYKQCLSDPNAALSKVGLASASPSPEYWNAIFWQCREKILQLLKDKDIDKKSSIIARMTDLMKIAYEKSGKDLTATDVILEEFESLIEKGVDELDTVRPDNEITIKDIENELQ